MDVRCICCKRWSWICRNSLWSTPSKPFFERHRIHLILAHHGEIAFVIASLNFVDLWQAIGSLNLPPPLFVMWIKMGF